MKKIIGLILITGGLILFLAVLYFNSRVSTTTRPFSAYTLLSASWEAYKNKFINSDGRVIDFSQNDITTSEGQSYALLRAVWSDDKPTFDRVYKWTSETLKRPQDNLFAWRWGKRGDGQYGFIEGGGENSASDADSDIALALILASKRWKDTYYQDEALKILKDLWEIETDVAQGKRYLIAGNWARNSQEIVINPSYISPYAYRIFAKLDKERDWLSLIDPSYELIKRSGEENLDKPKAVGLPPNWLKINKNNGQISPPNLANLTTDYSFDAIRLPFRIGLDYQWFKDEKALDYLNSYKYLEDVYKNEGKLVSSYSHDGASLSDQESPSMYATILGAFMFTNPDLAKDIYQKKVLNLYSNDANKFKDELPYYEQNWLWFGVAFMNDQLKNYE